MMEGQESAQRNASVLDFLQICGKLKTTKRTGWVNHKVALPESISDHMYRMGIISFLFTNTNLDRERMIKMALVHDMAGLTLLVHHGIGD